MCYKLKLLILVSCSDAFSPLPSSPFSFSSPFLTSLSVRTLFFSSKGGGTVSFCARAFCACRVSVSECECDMNVCV